MLHSALGLCALMFLAWLASAERSPFFRVGSRLPWRMIAAGLGLQFAIAGLVLKVPAFKALFMGLNGLVHALEEATRAGTGFVFGFVGGAPAPFTPTNPALTFSLAFQALPLVSSSRPWPRSCSTGASCSAWCGCSRSCWRRPWASAGCSAWARQAASFLA